MRVTFRRSFLVILAVALAPVLFADHFVADCPLSLVGSAAPATGFSSSPHAVFKNGSLIYALRGDRLTTLNINEVGEVTVARDDEMSPFGARDIDGGVTYDAGFMYVSSEAGLEIFDLRNVQAGPFGNAPIMVSRTPGFHYRRMTVQGNLLAGLYPARDLPCVPRGLTGCDNSIDIFNVANPANPQLVARIATANTSFIAFNDIKFANGYLYATGMGGTHAFDLSNPANPSIAEAINVQGDFLATNGTSNLAIGQETLIGVFTIGPGALLSQFAVFVLPTNIVDRSNPLMFHPEATFDGTHLVTMIDEKNQSTGKPTRTVAFDVFDFTVPLFEGHSERIYENVTLTHPDEVKHDPIIVGPYIYVNGEISGLQVWGACGQIAGGIELERIEDMNCGGAELRGFVTGAQRITNVEIFLDNNPLGTATITRQRTDISSRTPVMGWRLSVNLDQVPAGVHLLRAVGTDSVGNRRQFASQEINFPGFPRNCTNRRRTATPKR
jgi:hypothetical protein